MTNGNSGAEVRLLNDISGLLSKYVVLSRAQTDVIALWVIHSHAIEAADFTPYLHIYSPALRSGKTRLLEVLRLVVAKPWFTGRVTAAVLVRKTDKDHPTLLLDESDAERISLNPRVQPDRKYHAEEVMCRCHRTGLKAD